MPPPPPNAPAQTPDDPGDGPAAIVDEAERVGADWLSLVLAILLVVVLVLIAVGFVLAVETLPAPSCC